MYPTIQEAIDDSAVGDVIDLAAGTYTESVTLDRDVSIRGVAGAQWNGSSGSSIIDQQNNALILENLSLGNASGNRRAVSISEGGTLTAEGVTFNGVSTTAGGSITATDAASIVIANSTFLGTAGVARATKGGAINAVSSGTVSLTDVTFDHVQSSVDGGAIYATNVDVTCIRCTFDGASTNGSGAAIYSTGANLTVEQSLFCNGSSGSGNGGAIYGSSDATIRSTRFVENSAGNGAALYATGGTWTVTNNHFLGNVGGAALFAENTGTSLVAVNNLVYDNTGFGVAEGLGSAGITLRYNWFEGNTDGPTDGINVDITNISGPVNADGEGIDLVDWSQDGDCGNDQL
ncbi:MAG: right-handed parallel beta-helix repeat-containing protein, partial [Myxococcota bacterium]